MLPPVRWEGEEPVWESTGHMVSAGPPHLSGQDSPGFWLDEFCRLGRPSRWQRLCAWAGKHWGWLARRLAAIRRRG